MMTPGQAGFGAGLTVKSALMVGAIPPYGTLVVT